MEKKHLNLQRTQVSQKNNIFSLGFRTFFSKKKGLKGQMFMVAAIFMIVGFILLRNLLSVPIISQEKAYQDTSYLDKNMRNIKNEFIYLAGVASMQPTPNKTGVEYIHNFSRFIGGEFDSRMLSVYAFSNGTSSNFSVTIGNFLKDNISGALNATSSTPTGRTFALNDTRNVTLEFNYTAGWINLTLNYTIQNKETVERFNINASTRNYAAAFFDISLQDRGFFVRSKNLYNRTWVVS